MTRNGGAPSGEPRRVLLVEDEAMSRSLLADVLRNAGFEVAACATAREAMEEVRYFDPDAVVTDIDLGHGPTGLDLVVALTKRAPYLAVIILSNYAVTPDYRHGALGRAAYLRKQDLTSSTLLVEAIDRVLHDRPGPEAESPSGSRLSRITAQQAQVLRMVAEGLSNEEIARQRHASVKAVENMLTRIFAALELQQDARTNMRVAAARVYIHEAGLPSPPGE